ncbi:MAG: ROK family protein [Gammaproteobacteria bacterium]|nr:ROK family protein [Gammaproteobacteria bacterium]MBV9696004.1 ROK family protein [Gammaproteobacteria bacterium]
MSGESTFCFAADLGGTKLAAAIADARGRIVAELTEPTDRRGGVHVAEQIAACAGKLAQQAGIELRRARHVMVGVPGAVHPRTGRLSLTANIAGLDDFDVLGYLRGRFGPDVALENDVNLAMLGEQAFGCASRCRNAAFLALGTGAGLGLLIDNQLFRGAHGAAGEIADLPIGLDEVAGDLAATGTFELAVGSPAIIERYRRRGGTAAETVRDIFRRLEEGDEVAAAVLDTTAHWVAIAVVTLQALLDLELIVFGGSIGMRPELYERVRGALPTLFSRPIRIEPSRLGDRAGLLGAVFAATRAAKRTAEPGVRA